MQPDIEALQRTLLHEEVERLVEDAARRGEVIRTGQLAAMLLAIYPAANWSTGRVVDEITLAASKLKVPAEISRD